VKSFHNTAPKATTYIRQACRL